MFLFALCFIASESIGTFDFIKDILDELFFYNCSCSKVVYKDFTKGLAKCITTYGLKKEKIELDK